jgi:hypothetical protein
MSTNTRAFPPSAVTCSGSVMNSAMPSAVTFIPITLESPDPSSMNSMPVLIAKPPSFFELLFSA